MSTIESLSDQVVGLAEIFVVERSGLDDTLDEIRAEYARKLVQAENDERERLEHARVTLLDRINNLLYLGCLEDFAKPAFNNAVCKLAMMDGFGSPVWYEKLTEMCERSDSYFAYCNRWRADNKTGHATPLWTIVLPSGDFVPEKMDKTLKLMETMWEASQSHGDDTNFNGIFLMKEKIGGGVRQTISRNSDDEWMLELFNVSDALIQSITSGEASGGASSTSPLSLLEWVSENRS